MAYADSYATVEEYMGTITKTDGGSRNDITRDLEAVTRLVDKFANRVFAKSDAVQTRHYWTSFVRRGGGFGYNMSLSPAIGWAEAENPWLGMRGANRLIIDDIASSSGLIVKVDSSHNNSFETTLTLDTDFQLWPRNAALYPEPKPYNMLYMLPYGPNFSIWPPMTEVLVTATFGWPSIPKAITSAVIQLTAILRLESPRATMRISQFEGTIKASSKAMSIVDELIDAYTKKIGNIT